MPSDPESFDPVQKPAHYNQTAVQPIDVIESLFRSPAFHAGNAIKYIVRAPHKSPDTTFLDLQKARWYLSRWHSHVADHAEHRSVSMDEAIFVWHPPSSMEHVLRRIREAATMSHMPGDHMVEIQRVLKQAVHQLDLILEGKDTL